MENQEPIILFLDGPNKCFFMDLEEEEESNRMECL